MRRIFIYNVTVFFLFAFLVSSCGGKGENAVKGEKTGSESNLESTEWIELFNGKNFEGWISLRTGDEPPEGWKIENGEIVISGLGGKDADKAGDIITEKKYSDFELEFEWKMFTVGGNSGLKYYVNFYGENGGGPALGLEYQILDDDNHPWMLDGRMQPGDFHTVASCYELYAAVGKEVSPLGEWNSSKIISQNGQVEHWLNGKKVVEFDRFSEDFKEKVSNSKFKDRDNFGQQESGHILLQDHPGETHFRNIRIREL